ncbi:MAG: cobalt transporter CbiM [Acidobacteriota bacterium]|nr:cobalt transporter CbiM [Acidobacteriota bacterium]
MHIPDGYLSPSTCVTMYGASAPFWWVAMRRVKKKLHSQTAPLISVFAAFSFVIMMFNLPIPGGTTAHALGVGIAAIVLGPWASILSVSSAIFIQALFFGDGGITTFGANAFNMAIVGSLAAYLSYRLLAGRAPIAASRRVVAAAVAGYAAINVAALCAALELGVQPLLFKDAVGAPLYAPYPLSISIPAMMIAHLTFAGLAELVITGGIVAYLQRADPSLLRLTAPGAPTMMEPAPDVATRSGWSAAKSLWLAIALLMILTPLGILAGGAAWGEWAPRDFVNPAGRAKIAQTSHNVAPPTRPPAGIQRLSTLWTAPFPNYAPPFVKRGRLGYFLSALFGGGILIFIFLILRRFLGQKDSGRKEMRVDPGEA